MNVLLTLNSGQGADLGPNFTLSANNSQTVTPSTATLVQLLAGLSTVIGNTATQVTITSTGNCTNSLNLTIV
jgi:hypothetical protein